MQYKRKSNTAQTVHWIKYNNLFEAMQVQTMSFAGQHTEEQIRYTTKDISRGQIYNVVFKNDMHFTPLPLVQSHLAGPTWTTDYPLVLLLRQHNVVNDLHTLGLPNIFPIIFLIPVLCLAGQEKKDEQLWRTWPGPVLLRRCYAVESILSRDLLLSRFLMWWKHTKTYKKK